MWKENEGLMQYREGLQAKEREEEERRTNARKTQLSGSNSNGNRHALLFQGNPGAIKRQRTSSSYQEEPGPPTSIKQLPQGGPGPVTPSKWLRQGGPGPVTSSQVECSSIRCVRDIDT